MKAFKYFLMSLTALSTFAVVHAHAAGESTACQNIVQNPDAKQVNCNELSGDARTQCEARARQVVAPATSQGLN